MVNNKTITFLFLGLMLVSCVSFFSYNKNNVDEDISSYNIKTRYDCNKIQDNKKYNGCLSFYNKNMPYKLGDVLVPLRTIKE